MNIAYFDCFAGASGDMVLGALIHAGLPVEALRDTLAGLDLRGWELRTEPVITQGFAATRVQVITRDDVQSRSYVELDSMIASSRLPPPIKADSARILRHLAEVEARLHQEKIEEIHLHELGGMDTLIDIVGTVAGLSLLEIEQIFVSALPMGRGAINTRHGLLPLPAPAVAELARGVPIRAVDLQSELVTPTGAAILTTLADGYDTFPPMYLTRVGYGAGARELTIPNILRVFVGAIEPEQDTTLETLVVLETNIDDMNPQIYEYVFAKLFEAGALDVWMTPIQMKKNRMGALLSVLSRPRETDALSQILFAETTTLGVRQYQVQRSALAREMIRVETPFGQVAVKVARLNGRKVRATPEYEECRQLAEKQHVPLLEIYHAAESSIRSAFGS